MREREKAEVEVRRRTMTDGLAASHRIAAKRNGGINQESLDKSRRRKEERRNWRGAKTSVTQKDSIIILHSCCAAGNLSRVASCHAIHSFSVSS